LQALLISPIQAKLATYQEVTVFIVLQSLSNQSTIWWVARMLCMDYKVKVNHYNQLYFENYCCSEV
jgi:hypothetical protein